MLIFSSRDFTGRPDPLIDGDTDCDMQLQQLKQQITDALESLKGIDIKTLDVGSIAGFTDLMVIASGNSTRQVKALADRVVERCREAGVRPLGIEGEREAEWILVDFGDAVVHIMTPEMRDFYNLEKLWSVADRPSDELQARRNG